MARPGRLAVLPAMIALVWPVFGHAVDIRPMDVRLGDHHGVGRLVVSGPDAASVTWSHEGDQVTLADDKGFAESSRRGGRVPGIEAVTAQKGRLVVRLQPGSSLRSLHWSGRLVFDVTPGAASPTPEVPHGPAADKAPGDVVLPGLPAPMIAVVDAPNAPAPARSVAPAPPSAGAAAPTVAASPPADLPVVQPMSIAASLQGPPGQSTGLLLPFDRDVGAASFQRNHRLEIVFDSQKPIDLSGVAADPRFGRARFVLLASGAMLDIPCETACPMRVSRVADGWLVTPGDTAPDRLDPATVVDGLVFPFGQPGRVVVVADTDSGATILVGTVRDSTQRAATSLRTPSFRIVPALLGLAVERIADRIELRPTPTGFLLIDPYRTGSAHEGTIPANFSHVVQLWPVQPAEQWRRYKLALADAASRAPGARRHARLDAARSALSLGFGREARRLAVVADEDAPGGAEQSQSAFLTASGAFLAHDPDAETLLNDPRIGNSDEAVLWRSLSIARAAPQDRPAARVIADRLDLLLAYPDGLRRAIVGDAALSLATGGDEGGRALLSRFQDTVGPVALARALAAGKGRRSVDALAQLDRLVHDADPATALAAAREAIETRLQAGTITPAQAAKLLDQHVYDGRVVGRELPVMMRVEALKAQAHDWAGALADLRQASGLFPEAMADIRRAAGAVIVAISGLNAPRAGEGPSDTALDPFSAVGLIESYRDLLPPDFDRAGLSVGLADRLVSLDLPERAADYLRQAAAKAQPGEERARDGLALARLLLDGGDPTAARAALDDVDRSALPPAMATQRTVLDARLLSMGGNDEAALTELAPLQDRAALDLKATILAKAKNWQAEIPVLAALLADRVPAGPHGKSALDADVQDLVLRLAGALEQAGQAEALAELKRDWAADFPNGARRDMLELLAAPTVTSVGDLTRSGADLAATRNALTLLDGSSRPGMRQPM